MHDPEIETRPLDAQFAIDRERFPVQMRYLLARSEFYRDKLAAAGIRQAEDLGGLEDISALPFTEKDDLRHSQAKAPPFGRHLACDPEKLVRIYSTSGTTGVPCYIGLTQRDLEIYATNTARGYTAAGFRRGQRIAVGFNAGPFVAGAVYAGFDKLGCTVIPVGTGNTERLVGAMQTLGATGISCTPSYGLYLIDWCANHGVEPRSLGLRNMITAGEPGGGDPMIRARIEEAFGCKLRESMGIGDITLSAWAEDDDGHGMHFMARGFVHVELIEPVSCKPLPWTHGAQGELVYTALEREAMPLLRFRSRDHVVVNMEPNPAGRTGPRIRCVGRTDDMLIVRGVNLFPTAIRAILNEFRPEVGELFVIRPTRKGVAQTPPLPITVELGPQRDEPAPGLAERIVDAIRARLVVGCTVNFVRYGALPRETYKSRLVDFSNAA